jgi:hypothetical protein
MTTIKDLYYLYEHCHPETGEIVYVGIGTGSRAWNSGTSSGSYREQEHADWIEQLYLQGYTMADIVKISCSLLDKKDALELEDKLIKEQRPKFNKLGNPDNYLNKKYTLEQALEARQMYYGGNIPYYMIPAYFNLASSNMSVLGKRMVETANKYLKETE